MTERSKWIIAASVVGVLALTSLALLIIQWNSTASGASVFGSLAFVAGAGFHAAGWRRPVRRRVK